MLMAFGERELIVVCCRHIKLRLCFLEHLAIRNTIPAVRFVWRLTGPLANLAKFGKWA